MTNLPSFPALLERFLTQRLMQQRQASPHTISSYRDTFRQFLKFIEGRLHKPPSRLSFEEIDAPLVVTFLDSLEKQGLSVRSRNLRLTAIHSFFRYTSFEAPAHSAQKRPVYRTKWAWGAGIKADNFCSISRGVRIMCVVPSRHARLKR